MSFLSIPGSYNATGRERLSAWESLRRSRCEDVALASSAHHDEKGRFGCPQRGAGRPESPSSNRGRVRAGRDCCVSFVRKCHTPSPVGTAIVRRAVERGAGSIVLSPRQLPRGLRLPLVLVAAVLCYAAF